MSKISDIEILKNLVPHFRPKILAPAISQIHYLKIPSLMTQKSPSVIHLHMEKISSHVHDLKISQICDLETGIAFPHPPRNFSQICDVKLFPNPWLLCFSHFLDTNNPPLESNACASHFHDLKPV